MRKALQGRVRSMMLLLPLLAMGCGSPYVENLTSITVTPATLTVTKGQLQGFSASGVYSGALLHANSLAVNWSFTGFTGLPKPVGVTIDSNGFVACTTFLGTLPVYAVHPANGLEVAPYNLPATNDGSFVVATAQLACN